MTLKKIVFVVFGVCPFLIQLQAQEIAQRQANYELTDKFQDFTLGGKLSNISLSVYPREINDTDNFWFEFQTTVGKDYYYVVPAAGKREPLFDKGKMAMQLSELTKGVVDKTGQPELVYRDMPPASARKPLSDRMRGEGKTGEIA